MQGWGRGMLCLVLFAGGGEYISFGIAVSLLLPSQGLERTQRENFGGGNTAWEEEKLAKYANR